MPPSQKPGKEPDTSEGEWIHPYIHEREKHCLNADCSEYYFVKSFDLVNDEALLRAGVEICAFTRVKGDLTKNMILFWREEEESVVDCISFCIAEKEPDNNEDEWIHPYIHESEKHSRKANYLAYLDYYFEKRFELVNDEALLRAGVEICAVTEVKGDHVKNMIKFQRRNRESFVDCIHTTVCQFVLDPESEDGIEILSTEERPDLQEMLAPEEHYVAMKSFVGYLAENGILNSLLASFEMELEQGQEPLDFNHLMRQQLVRALIAVAPDAATDLVFLTLKHGSGGNLERLVIIVSELGEIHRVQFKDHHLFDLIRLFDPEQAVDVIEMLGFDPYDFVEKENLPEDIIRPLLMSDEPRVINGLTLSEELLYKFGRDENILVRAAIAERITLQTDLINELAMDDAFPVRLAIARRGDLPEQLCRRLAQDCNTDVLLAIAQKTNLPEDVIRTLTQDVDSRVLLGITRIRNLPDDIIRKLGQDKDAGVRLEIAKKPNLPEDIIQILAQDEDNSVRIEIMKKTKIGEWAVLAALERSLLRSIPLVGEIKKENVGVQVSEDHIIELRLIDCRLETLPTSIGELKSLKSLDLEKNQLSGLPESVAELRSLESLILRENVLWDLPTSFGRLKSLESLNLLKNWLKSLPESFGGLTSLRELNLYGNWLWTLPESFGKLKSLHTLNLAGNHLETLPASFGELKSLKRLHLNNNKLITLPVSFGGLKSLELLYLDRNQLTTLSDSFGELKSLQTLLLQGNRLRKLPESFGELKSLQTLHLQENQLTKLPESFGDLTSLIKLNLGGNQLTTLPASFAQLRSLRELNLDHNPWKRELAKIIWKNRGKYGDIENIDVILEYCRQKEKKDTVMTDSPEWIHPYIHKSEKHCLDTDCVDYYFEKRFDLVNDEALLRAGVVICAVTEVEDHHVNSMIKFQREDDESFVDCVHTTVCQFVLDPESEEGIEILSTEEHPDLQAMLAPEEHYVAMKSFVGYLVEKGILNSLVASYETEFEQGLEPLDFNHLMRQQMVRALIEMTTKPDLVFLILKHGAAGDLKRLEFIYSEFNKSELDELARVEFEDHHLYDLILLFDPVQMIKVIEILGFIPEDLIAMEDPPEGIIRRLLMSTYLLHYAPTRVNEIPISEDLLHKFSRDENNMVRAAIARRDNLTKEIIQILAQDEDIHVWTEISKKIGTGGWEVLAVIEHENDIHIPLVEELLPNSVGIQVEKRNITGLGLFRCKLRTFPEAFKTFKTLETLILDENYLTTLPEFIEDLKSLKTLSLSQNALKALPAFFVELKSLKTLSLYLNKLSTFPEILLELKSLENLSLGLNKITTLPVSFGKLQSLKELSLNGNEIITLPASFGKLQSLKKLDLNKNKLASLPESFGELTSLITLDLKQNQLRTLPESFGKLQSVKELDLNKNQLTSLPESFGELTSLITLDLKQNQLRTLPESFGRLKSLKELDLRGNKLTSLPESFGELTSLEVLDLSWNTLETLPASFGQLTSLRELRVDKNHWEKELWIINSLNRDEKIDGRTKNIAPILEYCRQKRA